MKKPALIAATLIAVSAPAAAGPALSTGWKRISVSQSECLRRAERAVMRFRPDDFKTTNRSAFGWNGSYTWVIRCVADEGIAMFAVAGPNATETERFVDDLREFF